MRKLQLLGASLIICLAFSCATDTGRPALFEVTTWTLANDLMSLNGTTMATSEVKAMLLEDAVKNNFVCYSPDDLEKILNACFNKKK